jgi:ABC-type transport system involved in cytochrome c biogenesis permease subunit
MVLMSADSSVLASAAADRGSSKPEPLAALCRHLASLRLTVVLFALSMLVVFAGTLAQVKLGIDQAIAVYFRSWVVTWDVPGLSLPVPVLPGGWTLVILLLANMSAAWSRHFRPDWRQAGIWLSHAAVFILLAGELLIGLLQQEWVLPLDEGQSAGEVQAYRRQELAFVHPERGTLTIPQDQLRPGARLDLPGLPFQVEVEAWHPHAELSGGPATPGLLPSGVGLRPAPPPTAMGTVPEPAAVLKITAPNGASARWIVSSRLRPQEIPGAGGWTTALRFARHPLPFTFTLDRFVHEKHAGTEIPRHFASHLRMRDHATGESRAVVISMNEPLRHAGWTFYQQSFANEGRTTVLHAVRNPARWLPYIGCALAALGLAFHFALHLGPRLPPRSASSSSSSSPPPRRFPDPWFLAPALAALALLPFLAQRPAQWHGADLTPLLQHPVLDQGRVKPLETVARASLLSIHGKSTLKDGSARLSAGTWLAEVFFDPAQAYRRPLFRVDNADVLRALGFNELAVPAFLSLNQIDSKLDLLTTEARAAAAREAAQRSRYQRDVLRLFGSVRLLFSLTPALIADPLAAPRIQELQEAPDTEETRMRRSAQQRQFDAWAAAAGFRAVPSPNPGDLESWTTPAEVLGQQLGRNSRLPSPTLEFTGLAASAAAGDWDSFERFALQLRGHNTASLGPLASRARSEALFHRANLFGAAMALYLLATLLALAFWIRPSDRLRRAGCGLAAAAALIHTAALLWRMILEGRPPVTNLYSSAIFIGWAAALLGLVLERARAQGTGLAVAGAGGFSSLIIAHHLSIGGDTMEAMRAVLDSNFWLATHVVTITLGYAAVFVAGFIGAAALIRRAFGHPPQPADESMAVAATAIGLFLSFVGTVLGGIWADQSWGRFWGWDPKENGALLIVLWTALILHARLAGWARRTGTLALAVFGNIVTAWSWFGTNMLGIGLHSYGFTDAAFFWLAAFAALNFGLMALAAFPARRPTAP